MYPLPCIQSKPMSILSVVHATESKPLSVCHEPSLRLNCPNLRVPLGGLLRGCDTKSYSETFSWMSWVGMRTKGKYKDFLPRVGEGSERRGVWKRLEVKSWVPAGCLCSARDSFPDCLFSVLLFLEISRQLSFQTAFSCYSLFKTARSPKQFSLAILIKKNYLVSSSLVAHKPSLLFYTSIQYILQVLF